MLATEMEQVLMELWARMSPEEVLRSCYFIRVDGLWDGERVVRANPCDFNTWSCEYDDLVIAITGIGEVWVNARAHDEPLRRQQRACLDFICPRGMRAGIAINIYGISPIALLKR